MPQSLSKEKISHTILEFGRDLILDLPEDHTKEELEACMQLVVTVWNAVTLDSWKGGNEHQDMLHQQMESAPREMQFIVKELVKRKTRNFSTDDRAVGRTWVTYRDGEYVFGCDARANSKDMQITGSIH
jgi:hypothetical protein